MESKLALTVAESRETTIVETRYIQYVCVCVPLIYRQDVNERMYTSMESFAVKATMFMITFSFGI